MRLFRRLRQAQKGYGATAGERRADPSVGNELSQVGTRGGEDLGDAFGARPALLAGFAVILVGIGLRLKRLRWVVLATNVLAILAFVESLVAFSSAQILVDVTFLIISLYVSFSIFCFGRIRRLESFLTSKSA